MLELQIYHQDNDFCKPVFHHREPEMDKAAVAGMQKYGRIEYSIGSI